MRRPQRPEPASDGGRRFLRVPAPSLHRALLGRSDGCRGPPAREGGGPHCADSRVRGGRVRHGAPRRPWPAEPLTGRRHHEGRQLGSTPGPAGWPGRRGQDHGDASVAHGMGRRARSGECRWTRAIGGCGESPGRGPGHRLRQHGQVAPRARPRQRRSPLANADGLGRCPPRGMRGVPRVASVTWVTAAHTIWRGLLASAGW